MSDKHTLGRRDFLKTTPLVLGGIGALANAASADAPATTAPGTPTTVQDVIDHLFAEANVEPIEDTVDTIKVGDPAAPVRGIVTTFMATIPVIQQTIQRHANFIITHEPTFYSHDDATDWLENDPVYQHKRALLDKHGITVWRYHDHIHQIKPDPFFIGLFDRLGWADAIHPDDPRRCTIPTTTLAELTEHCKRKLGVQAMNYVGQPDMACTHVGVLPGAHGGARQIGLLSEGHIEVIICGEVAEWETNEYVRDSQYTDKPVGLIVTGHQASEEDGMKILADQLKTQLPNIPTHHLPAGDSFTHT